MSGMTAEIVEPLADLDVIDPIGTPIEIVGVQCVVNRLKAREFLALVRVMTIGLGDGLRAVSTSLSMDDEEALGQELLALLLLAIPEAGEEFLAFVRLIVEPKDPKQKATVLSALENPDLDVLIDVAEMVVLQEAEDLHGLAGKARAAWTRIASLYQPKKETKTPQRKTG
jgi:hypothetical protein